MNTSRPHFDNEKVRQAVNFAIDRQTILDQSGKYAGTPSRPDPAPGRSRFQGCATSTRWTALTSSRPGS